MALKNKKGNWPIAVAIIIAAFLVVGAISVFNEKSTFSIGSEEETSTSNSDVDVYLESISGYNSSLFEINTEGTGTAKSFEIKVDKDNLGNSARKESFSLKFKQKLPEGIALDKNSIRAHTLYVAPTKDISLENTSGSSIEIFDYDSSTIDGTKESVQKTFTAADAVSVNVTLSFNPQSKDITTIKEWDEIGEEYVIDQLKFGQSNAVSFEINN